MPHSHHHNHSHMLSEFKRKFWISLLITIPIFLLSPMIQTFLGLDHFFSFTGDVYVLWGLSTLIFCYGGWPFLKGMIQEIAQHKPGMMTLIGIAISTAYFYSSLVVFGLSGNIFFWELASLIDIMLLGHWIEMKSVLGASQALEKLAQLMPAQAHKILPDGNIREIPLAELQIDDYVLVKPGEKIPADGVITNGQTSINESMLTGESKPVSKKLGDTVIGGAINGENAITVQIKRMGNDSFLAQVIKLVKQAQESKSKTQDIANRAASYLTFIALTAALITLLAWLILSHESFSFVLERVVTVMVISCPHALGLAVPLVIAVSTAIAAQKGLLIRNRTAFEAARHVNAIVFDKTGTLTEGKFGITDIVILDKKINEKDLINFAAALESNSEHPIAQGIAKASTEHLEVQNFHAIPGLGAEAKVKDQNIKVVSPVYLQQKNLKIENEKIDEFSKQGKTVVFVLIDNQVKAAIALADIIRPESKAAISRLKSMGIRCLMLTGDNQEVAKWVAETIGLDDYFAEVLPQDKVKKIKEVQSKGFIVAMTGDGVNDAPALAQADIGIAIGAGTDIAIESADIILVKSNPQDVVTVIKLSRATTRKMFENLAWATGYNTIAIPLAAGVLYSYGILLSPALGAILMSLSTIIVALNAKFLSIK